ncbi:nucleotide exchange factor GrpE [Kitasatospora camelliae]|uniref:Protein GrpE n=1 Tax=Kitasatospora camelliae TaxID=3156397 RepID=A0AAU8K299_9ACTN
MSEHTGGSGPDAGPPDQPPTAAPAVPPGEAMAPEPPPGPEQQLAERTADLQRLQAEYENYRKRVHRDRLAVREIAVVNVLTRLLPALDALDAARALGELTGGLRAVAGLLESELGELGLQSFGEPGEPFDPSVHEAVGSVDAGADVEPFCVEVVRPGYRVGDHLLRPAEVVVARAERPFPG